MGALSLTEGTRQNRPVTVLDMGSSLDMQTAETLAGLLREAAGLSRPVVIDASAVERVSTSAIQLLLAMDRAMSGAGGELTLENPSGAFMAAFADCGIRPADMNWKHLSEGVDG